MARFIFVTGGVLSSLGKGIASASIATLLQSRGFKVRLRKLDPYINVDPGTMSPYQHGEVFVTDDGAETDLDLGHYERYTGIPATANDNTTAGRIYYNVISKERKGDYLGRTVQVIPHITDEIKKFITHDEDKYDFIICEIGGTIGDIEGLPFIEAMRQLKNDRGPDHVLCIHVALVPYVETAGELKTKPAQHSVKELLSLGIQPNMLLCRSHQPISGEARTKLSQFCNIHPEYIIDAVDVANIYDVPIKFFEQGLDEKICMYFKIPHPLPASIARWEKVKEQLARASYEVNIGLIGKYSDLPDAYKSLLEALTHAGAAQGIKVITHWVMAEDITKSQVACLLSPMSALLIPGGFGERGAQGKLLALEYARKHAMPCLGICFGMQLMVIEYARNMAGIPKATSTELEGQGEPVVALLTEWEQEGKTVKRTKNMQKGGTMRVGAYPCVLKPGSKTADIYKAQEIHERHRHRYEVNTAYKTTLEKAGMIFSGMSPDGLLPEIVEIADHPWMIGVQFHPEFKSYPFAPHPLFQSYITAAKVFKESHAKEG